jgi:cytochrome c-type biogenesis protein CcmH
MIWVFFTTLTVLAVAGLLWPIRRGAVMCEGDDRNAHDRAVFRDQLAELDRDVARGAIAGPEAEAARNEISRRLLAVAAGRNPTVAGSGQRLAVAAALAVALAAPLAYLQTGAPHLPDVPFNERLARATETGDVEAMLVKVEQHLAASPDDIEGWKVAAPAYHRAGRWQDAAEARRQILRLSPGDPAAMADYGEALTLAADGKVTPEAQRLFAGALAHDPRLPKARFYAALALKQEGRAEAARAAFAAFLAETPADAPWREALRAELEDIGKTAGTAPPGPDAESLAAAAAKTPAERQAMIAAMVDGLEARLRNDGDELDGWLRLIRARAVLGQFDKVKWAYGEARQQFKDDAAASAALAGLAAEIRIE